MDENKLNNISKKLFENLEFEKTSKDFTEKLMLKIEQETKAEKVRTKPFFFNKFMIIFILTFSLIALLGFMVQGKASEKGEMQGFFEKIKWPSFSLDFFSKYLNLNLDFGLIAKLVIGSIIILIIIDLASGSLIDRIIDSRSRKENRI